MHNLIGIITRLRYVLFFSTTAAFLFTATYMSSEDIPSFDISDKEVEPQIIDKHINQLGQRFL